MNLDINQGLQFKKYGKKYYKENEHALLTATSSPTWGSIVEAFNDNDSIRQYNAIVFKQLSSDEAEFNNELSAYSTLYNTYTSTMLMKQPTDADRVAMENALTDQKTALFDIATKINNHMDNLHGTSIEINTTLAEKRRNIKEKMEKLHEQYSFNSRYDVATVDGKIETTQLNNISNYYHAIVYFLITVTLLAFTFYLYVNPAANVLNPVYVVVALLLLYIISRYFVL